MAHLPINGSVDHEMIWYGKHPISLILTPLGWLYCLIAMLRRYAYSSGLLHSSKLPVPVIVVGNISVGGTGKTPLVIWLVKFLREQGYQPGVISRGYGGQAEKWPQNVTTESDPFEVGDEPVMIARQINLPVVVAPDRVAAGQTLLREADCDIIVCDDGLQHYSLQRDFEICVIDGSRRHGNGRCLPAGPLREPVSRLKSVDIIVCNGCEKPGEFPMTIKAGKLHSVCGVLQAESINQFKGRQVHAIAGTGNPQRFFDLLTDQGLIIDVRTYPDHHTLSKTDISFADDLPVIMTEKDAVKCTHFADERHWYLPVEAEMTDSFKQRLMNMLKRN